MVRHLVVQVLLGLVAVSPALAVVPTDPPANVAASRLRAFTIEVMFLQDRPWTYYHQQTSPECTRTTDGSGYDHIQILGSGLFQASASGRTGSGSPSLVGDYRRAGSRSLAVTGGECSQTGTTSEPQTGCGAQAFRPPFANIRLRAGKLRLHWESGGPRAPVFSPCPTFTGSNEASDGNELPGSHYADVTAPLSATKLRGRAKRIHAIGRVKLKGIENCANIVQGCPDGVTYSATASVTVDVRFTLIRRKR